MKSDPKYYVLTAIITVILTVFILDFYGYIRHSDARDEVVSEFSSLQLVPGEEFRMSPKKSQHKALCINDFIVVETTTPDGKLIRSLLMDSKKRGLPCSN